MYLSNEDNTKLGILEWFHIGEYERVETTLQHLKKLNIRHLRTGISWADYYCAQGAEWYAWLLPYLAKDLELLPCFLYTPPSIGILPKTSSPPNNAQAYADFLDEFVNLYGKHFECVELWNEPNNRSEYDYTLDKQWEIFSEMIGKAAFWMKQLDKKTVLGGMSPVDPNWLQLMYDRKVMNYIDAVGIHQFPFVFDEHWHGWQQLINQVQQVIQTNNGKQKIWITETGFSTWQHDERMQLAVYQEAIQAPVERVYWYGLHDLDPKHPTVDGFHTDEREYAFGLIKTTGAKKLLYRLLEEAPGIDLSEYFWITQPPKLTPQNYVVVFGGAGFIGTNVVKQLLDAGEKVLIVDNLSRHGVEQNLKWLNAHYPKNLTVLIADIRNPFEVEKAIAAATFVFHFAAQVAVTTSCLQPVEDFDINAKGTLNILEAIRKSHHQPPMLFTSTNKVYGGLDDVAISLIGNRYEPERITIRTEGISEERALDFHSPYGCSKGIADSYIKDYVRTYGLKAVIFRMSCIYGPHQHGNEDQGWVAHFIIQALNNLPITIYGDGKQVRDILFVDDLVKAMFTAKEQIDRLKGEVFNMGGGPENTISLLELIERIETLHLQKLKIAFADWRPGDQRYYVSDISKFASTCSWLPLNNTEQGINKLYLWLKEHLNVPVELKGTAALLETVSK